MLSFIHILFIYLFINTRTSAARSGSKCLTFKKIKEDINSLCAIATIFPKNTACLTCNISEINNITKNTCIKNFTCVDFKFSNDSLFEYTTKNHREIIYDLFKNISKGKNENIFNISLREFNRKDINKSFIESILGNNTKPYYYLDLHILKRDLNQTLPHIDTNLSQINILQFALHMPCNSKKKIHYHINKTGIVFNKDLVCNTSSTTLPTTIRIVETTQISTNHMKLSTTEMPIITQELTTINLIDVVQTKLLPENNSTIITTSKLFSSTAKPSRKLFLFLLPGLLIITILVSLIIMRSILKNRRKPIDIINDNSSNESPELSSDLSDTEISSAMSSLPEEFSTAPNLKNRTTLAFADEL